MLDAQVKASGPLFEKPDLLAALLRASHEAAEVLGQRTRDAYSGGIVRRGPGRYGHVADVWRTAVVANGFNVTTRIYPQGKAAFKTLFLEKGVRGPHRGGLTGVFPKDRRDRAASAAGGHAAALKLPGPIFRRSARPPGAPAFHVLDRVMDQQWPAVQPIFQREIAAVTGAA